MRAIAGQPVAGIPRLATWNRPATTSSSQPGSSRECRLEHSTVLPHICIEYPMAEPTEMSWTEQYWDIVSDFYWVPSYLGLKSIPRSDWVIDGDRVVIPRSMTNPSGPLYRRTQSGDDYWQFVMRQEETFNHVFNLAFATLPGDVIAELFSPFISAESHSDYELQGRDVRDQYEWIAGENVVTPDSFLIAKDSLLAVELKFNAKTSLDQVAKYVALLAGEELRRGPRQSVDLLFIFPSDAALRFTKQTSVPPSELGVEHYDLLKNSTKNERVRDFFSAERQTVRATLSRMAVSCVSWTDFTENLTRYARKLGATAGDRTLYRLLSGLVSAICAHPYSRVEHR